MRAVVEVLFGDALLADLAWELLLGAELAAPRAADAGDSGLLTPAAAFVRVVDGEKRGEVVEGLTSSSTCRRSASRRSSRCCPRARRRAAVADPQAAVEQDVRRVLPYPHEAEHCALLLPPTTGVPPPTPLTAQQADALVLGGLDVALDELNLYALEVRDALMAASLVDEALEARTTAWRRSTPLSESTRRSCGGCGREGGVGGGFTLEGSSYYRCRRVKLLPVVEGFAQSRARLDSRARPMASSTLYELPRSSPPSLPGL